MKQQNIQRQNHGLKIMLWTVGMLVLFVADLMVGDVSLTIKEVWLNWFGEEVNKVTEAILSIRTTRVILAFAIGIVLPITGLMMQTLFQNPLADPYILGISSGTSLGVALFVLGVPLFGYALPSWVATIGMLGAGWIGASVVLLTILLLSRRVSNIFGVLIIGVMLSYISSAIIQILQYFSSAEQLKLYSLWSLGTLSLVTTSQLLTLLPLLLLGLTLSLLSIKSLNLQLLGDQYAITMGSNPKRTRLIVFTATALMVGSITVYCGPIGFVGLAVPHISKVIFQTADHRTLLPASAVIGACIMLFTDIIAKWLLVPINAVTALMGVPVILMVIFRQFRQNQ